MARKSLLDKGRKVAAQTGPVNSELRSRLLFVLIGLVMFRIGSYVPVPGVNAEVLARLFEEQSGTIIGMFNMFSGGALERASVLALGIMPYISASIIIQLLAVINPTLAELRKEGESGRRKITQYTRVSTLFLAALQAVGIATGIPNMMPGLVDNPGFGFYFVTTVSLVTGTMFLMWLGEQITERGIGNGISLIIMIGIVARLPHALLAEINARFQTSDGSAIMLILELVLLFLVFMATVALVQAVRKIPVQYAKRIVGNKQYGGVRQYIPLKMNAANVMPIIFAQALMFIPMLFANVAPGFAAAFSDMRGFWYNLTLGILVVAFTYFYTAIIINPQMMADDMKRNGGFIPGVKPGKATVNYIDTIMTRITLPGSIFLALVAILPALAMKFLNIQQAFAYFYGGTSLLIMVGVILDTLKQIESYLLMRHYDGLMKTGRIQGRY